MSSVREAAGCLHPPHPWCWSTGRQAAAGSGAQVYTPTLTGLGERSHLLSPAVNLDTHILDIVHVLRFEELNDVVLVGKSYSAMVMTGVIVALEQPAQAQACQLGDLC